MLTILSPAGIRALTTPEAVQAFILNGEAGHSDALETSGAGVRLQSLIDRASDVIESYCGRRFGEETVQEVMRFDRPTGSLLLARWPLVSIVSLQVNGTSLPVERVEADPQSGILYRLSDHDKLICWPAGRVSVVYKAGYCLPHQSALTEGENAPPLPDVIEHAALILVRIMASELYRDPQVQSEEIPEISATRYFPHPYGLPPQVQDMLSRFRVPSVG